MQFDQRLFPSESVLLVVATHGVGWTLLNGTEPQEVYAEAAGPSRELPQTNSTGYASYTELCQLSSQSDAVTNWDGGGKQASLQLGDQWFGYDSPLAMTYKVCYKSVSNAW